MGARSHKMILIAALLADMAAAPVARAAQFYFGACIGGDLNRRFGDSPGNLNSDSTSKFFLGWQIRKSFSLEVSYHDFGNARCCGAQIADLGFDIAAEGGSVALGYAPTFSKLLPFATLGYFLARSNGSTLSVAGPLRINDRDGGIKIEGGLRYFLAPTFAVRSGYEWFDFDGGAAGSLNFGIELRF